MIPVRADPEENPGKGPDRYVVAIREAMASGWGVVVAGAHVRTAYEAARACGRLGDIVLVHARPPALLPFYVGVEARRAPSEWDCGKWGRGDSNGLRIATVAEMVRPRGVTLILDAARPDIVALPIAAAMYAPDAPRVLLVHSWPMSPGEGKPPYPAILPFPEGAGSSLKADAAIVRFMAMPAVSEGDGTVLFRGGGRTVLTQFLPPRSANGGGSRPGRPSMRIVEAEDDGWLAFAEWRSPGLEASQIKEYARFAWLHGTHRPPPGFSKVAVPTIPLGNVPWIGRKKDPGHAKSDAAVVEVFGADAVGLQESLSDIVPARAVYRATRVGDTDRRIQFLRTWPGFRDDLLDPEVAAAVDSGGRVVPILAAIHGVTPAAIRRLAGRAKPAIWARLDHRHGDAAGPAGIAAIGHDRLPTRGDEPEWEAFDRLADVAMAILHEVGLHKGDGEAAFRWVGGMLGGIPGRGWQAREKALRAISAFDHGDLVRDMLRDMASHLRWLGATGADAAVAMRLFPVEPGFAGLVAAAHAWHADPVLRLGSHGIGPDTAWEVPFDPVDLGDGWRAVPLDSMGALVSEGASGPDDEGVPGLSHCVASYAPRCLRGNSLIVSIRRVTSEGWTRVSTAELVHAPNGSWRIDAHGIAMGLAQHRGDGNATPSKEASKILERLRTGLAEGTVPARYPNPGTASGAAVEGAAARQALALHGRWRSILPGRLGRMDAPGLASYARDAVERVRTQRP